MHIVRPPFLLKAWYLGVTWNRSRANKMVYLTFDDGPIPEITPWILDTLAEYGIKATFFCVGENIVKHPEIYQRLLDEQHAIGNHTFNHIKGWNHNCSEYLDNIEKCQQHTKSKLFRPPYGKIKKSQITALKTDYEIILWDVLTGDYNSNISAEQCLNNCIKHSRNGSIIVFHDNIKAIPNLKYTLPRAIQHFIQRGMEFGTL